MTHPFAKEMRLIWIDARLEIGDLSRRMISDAFRISTPQASNDIKTYQAEHPERIAYDPRAKCYRRPSHARPAYPAHLRHQVMHTVFGLAVFNERKEQGA